MYVCTTTTHVKHVHISLTLYLHNSLWLTIAEWSNAVSQVDKKLTLSSFGLKYTSHNFTEHCDKYV